MGGRGGANRTVKKKYERDAQLAFWFKVDPSDWPEDRKIGYLANLERVKAQDILHQGNYEPTDYRGIYDLTLLAYGDKELARQARDRALTAYVDAQCGRGANHGGRSR